MGEKGALNYLPIMPKAFVYVIKVMRKPVMGGNTTCLRLSRTCGRTGRRATLSCVVSTATLSGYTPSAYEDSFIG